jgi:hypothetical protein
MDLQGVRPRSSLRQQANWKTEKYKELELHLSLAEQSARIATDPIDWRRILDLGCTIFLNQRHQAIYVNRLGDQRLRTSRNRRDQRGDHDYRNIRD